MKHKILLSLAAIAFSTAGFAQNGNVGIGTTTPNADAKLDITATNKGLLLPRVVLTGTANAAPLSAHVAGMTVYNTKDTLDVTKGTYYNNGIKWIKIGDAASAWSLTGNTGTTPGINYLGTKDSNALVFKTNATNDTNRKMTILPNGKVGIGTTNPLGIFHTVYEHQKFPGSDISLSNNVFVEVFQDNTDWSGISYRMARGTAANPQNLAYNTGIGGFDVYGYISDTMRNLGKLVWIYKGDGTTRASASYISTTKGIIYIDTTGYVGIGTVAPVSKLQVVADQPTNNMGDNIDMVSYSDTYTPSITTSKYMGTLSSPQAVTAGKFLGTFTMKGYNGTSLNEVASVRAFAETNFATSQNTSLLFQTHDGTNLTDKMIIKANGNVGINLQNPISKLGIKGSVAIGEIPYAGGNFTGLPFLPSDSAKNVLWLGDYKGRTSISDYAVIYAELNIVPNAPVYDVSRLNIMIGDNSANSPGIDDEIAIGNIDYVLNRKDGLLIRNGKLGIGQIQDIDTANYNGHFYPKTALHLQKGDVYLEQITSGVIMKSPDGNCWKVTIANGGTLAVQSITCP